MIRAARLAAMVLPVLGLAGLWAQSDRHYRQGTEWEVPIQGYDPRDFLRGHYVEFTYDWPGLDFWATGSGPEALCLEGVAPQIERVTLSKADATCAHRLIADSGHVYGENSLGSGRLYIGQDRALALEEQLRDRDQRGIDTIRQREDGSFTPIAIRFRPLTPRERAEQDARNERAEELPPPPAIMSR